ncbi:MAG: ABC transporter ATP-binding protein [Burkholderiaceae bacterium]
MSAALQVSKVTRSFGALRAVSDVSLQIAPGERRAILGTNGAGKTTLFNLIAGDLPPTSGTIRLLDRDVSTLPAFQRARLGISRTYQASRVLRGLPVRDNLFLAVRGVQPHRFSLSRPRANDKHRQRAEQLAEQVGLTARFDTAAGELSHGEQRQLEIGMALAGEPRVMLLDEPAAGLSPTERPALTQLLRRLPAQMTIVLIEHDMDVALSVADRVSVMNEGALIFEGSPGETSASPLVQSLYLGTLGREDAAHH